MKKTNYRVVFCLFIFLCLITSCKEEVENKIPDSKEIFWKDTTISTVLSKRFNTQIQDYFSISKFSDLEKLKKYTPSFLYKCTIESNPEFMGKYSQKDFFRELIKIAVSGKDSIRTNLKKLNAVMKHEIKGPNRIFIIDTTLFANVDIASFYIYQNKRREIISNLISISEDYGENWRFLDKDGCREFLECQFGNEAANLIMSK